MARPRIRIDLAELEKLASMQCTVEEIAAFFGVSVRTIQRHAETAKFREAMEQGKAKGRVSVRRHLFRLAGGGNVAAAIFLAKNLLGYRDVVANEHSGPGGAPISVEGRPVLSKLSNEDLQQLRTLVAKTNPGSGN